MNRLGANLPPELPIPMVSEVADHLPDEEDHEESEEYRVGRRRRCRARIADAVHLRQEQQDEPQGETADGRPEPLRSALHGVAAVLDGIQDLREDDLDHPASTPSTA